MQILLFIVAAIILMFTTTSIAPWLGVDNTFLARTPPVLRALIALVGTALIICIVWWFFANVPRTL